LHAAKLGQPALRMPLTASSWLNVTTQAAKANMAQYPQLSMQYQKLVSSLVKNYTDAGVAVILDLHW